MNFKNRRLQVDILTIFLILICASSVTIIAFTYSKNFKSIIEYTTKSINQVSNTILERATCLINDAQHLVESGAGLFLSLGDISPQNTSLNTYMLNVIKYYPNLYGFYVGTREGNFIEAVNLSLANQTHYFSDPSKPLPPDAIYGLRIIKRNLPTPTTWWFYKDKNLNTVGEEIQEKRAYDPRGRPWYTGVEETGGLFWTDIYRYDPTNELGISVAQPVLNPSGEVIAVAGADLSFTLLSQFLAAQKIGKTGRAYILSGTGDVIIGPKEEKAVGKRETTITKELIYAAYGAYLAQSHNNFIFLHEETRYLASANRLPLAFGKEGMILVVVPLHEFFEQMILSQREILLISLLILILSSFLVVFFAKRIARPIVVLAEEVDRIKALNFASGPEIRSNIREINMMNNSVISMRAAIRSFVRYVPKEIVQQLIHKGEEISLGGEKKEVSIFFSGISDFSSLIEDASSETIMSLLGQYFDVVSEIILEYQGTIDKYIGDDIMAFWGAPLEINDHASKACTAALYCQARISSLNEKRVQQELSALQVSIGIHTGTAIVGNIGTAERMNYTVIGDAVNTAFRLKGLDKQYHTHIIISEEVRQKIGNDFLVRPLDVIAVKGRKEKVKIYELMAKKDVDSAFQASSDQIELALSFTQAYAMYHQGKLTEAMQLFEDVSKKFPFDFPTKLYIEKIKHPEN